MNVADDHSRWNDDLAAYALGALDAHAMAAFAKHLSACDTCQAELHRLAPAVELLAGGVEQLDPPPGLRERILGEVEADAAVAGVPSPAPSARRRRWRGRPLIALAGSAAVAAAVAIGVLVAGGGDEGGGGPVTTVQAQALSPANAAAIDAALVRDGDDWRLDVARLPPLRGSRVYQTWVMRDRRVTPSTLFVLSRDGTATVAIPQALRDGDSVLVTSEPRGGSPQPTTRPLLAARA
jgi:anti-sigma-K factor RskA